MMTIFERKAHILIVMWNIGFVMHHKKLPESHILDLFMVFFIMLYQQWQPQHLMEFRRGNQVKREDRYDKLSFHEYKYTKDQKRLRFPPFLNFVRL